MFELAPVVAEAEDVMLTDVGKGGDAEVRVTRGSVPVLKLIETVRVVFHELDRVSVTVVVDSSDTEPVAVEFQKTDVDRPLVRDVVVVAMAVALVKDAVMPLMELLEYLELVCVTPAEVAAAVWKVEFVGNGNGGVVDPLEKVTTGIDELRPTEVDMREMMVDRTETVSVVLVYGPVGVTSCVDTGAVPLMPVVVPLAGKGALLEWLPTEAVAETTEEADAVPLVQRLETTEDDVGWSSVMVDQSEVNGTGAEPEGVEDEVPVEVAVMLSNTVDELVKVKVLVSVWVDRPGQTVTMEPRVTVMMTGVARLSEAGSEKFTVR